MRVIPKSYFSTCEIIEVDANNEVLLHKKITELQKLTPIHAILPGFEYYVPISARLNNSFNLKGLPVKTADALHFKDKMRQVLRENGIKMPNFIVIDSLDGLYRYADQIKFPCVVKPSHLAGSLYIKKIYSVEELEYHLQTLFKDEYLDLGHAMQGNILIEDYIEGKEYSVEGYIQNGKINFVSVTDKFLSEEPYFIEMGHITKANVSSEEESILLNYTTKIIKALGVNLGPFHCELRLNGTEVMLIEIASRLVGDNISEIIELTTGISLAEEMVKSYLGFSFNKNTRILPENKRYAGVRFIYGNSGFLLDQIEGIAQVQKMKGFHRFDFLTKPGRLIHPFTDFRARIAEIVFHGESYKAVQESLNIAQKQLTIKTMAVI